MQKGRINMKAQHFDERLLNSAWQEIEVEFRSSGMVDPAPGFVNRWKERLAYTRLQEQRRQAWIFVAINTVAALALLSMIGVLRLPALSEPSKFFVGLIEIASHVFVFVKMVFSVLGSLLRTLPGVVPLSWWTSILVSMIGLTMLWFSMARQIVQRQGVDR
jgi:hypothetical protein